MSIRLEQLEGLQRYQLSSSLVPFSEVFEGQEAYLNKDHARTVTLSTL